MLRLLLFSFRKQLNESSLIRNPMAQYWLTRFCFQRFLAVIYLMAFLVTLNQFRPLIGVHGLTPVPIYLKRVRFWEAPSLFWVNSSDGFMAAAAWVGLLLSVIAMVGLSERFGIWVSAGIWFLLWLIYLSFVNVGQIFYGFGWEILLLEAGFLAVFLGSSDTKTPVVIIWLLRWLLFRVLFGAGMIKLRGDSCWRDLTCLIYHYETQPLPNPLSWYLHHLPPLAHKGGTLFTHFVELVVPWGVFAPGLVGCVAGVFSVLFQITLILSGNLSWLNYLTLALSLSCFDDQFLSHWVPLSVPATDPISGIRQGIILALGMLILFLSIPPVLNLISPRQIMNTSFEPLHLVNTYGAFGSVTRERMEIIIEGTNERVLTPATQWQAYEFKAKPGDVRRRPPIVAPYHYRLDWLMWFAAMSDYWHHPWFLDLVRKLLEGDRETLKLLANNPFSDFPPQFIRADLYEYHFTGSREKEGAWWRRRRVETYLRPVSLQDFKNG